MTRNSHSDLTARSASPSPLDGAALLSVNEDSIKQLVYRFYDAVRQDPVIGPVFNREIEPTRWPVHLDKMCAFWSSVLLRTKRYDGQPLSPHLRFADVSDLHFRHWLALFGKTARNVFSEEDASVVINLAERIAYSFRMAMAFHRGEDTIGIRPFTSGASA